MANVLVIRFSYFGDVAMLVPVVYSAAKTYPQDTFFVLTSKPYAVLFECDLPNLKVIGINLSGYKGIGGMWKLANELRSYDFHAVADMNNVLRSISLREILRPWVKKVKYIDKGKTEKNRMAAQKIPLKPLKSTFERYSDVFSALGYPFKIAYNGYFNYVKEDASLLKDIPFDASKKNIGIAPFAKHAQKTYPTEKMEEVIRQLSEKQDTFVYLFGGKDDLETLQKWEQKFHNVFSVATKLNLKAELLLMSYLRTMISMDSANMHLASLVGIPVVSVWGGTHPYLGFYGFNQSSNDAVQTELYCRPCSATGVKPCHRGDWACLHGIEPTAIVLKTEKYIS